MPYFYLLYFNGSYPPFEKGLHFKILFIPKKLLNDHIEEYEGESKEVKKEVEEVDMVEQTNKSMSLLMPIMSISISLVAPLGLALYWLTSNVLMILERFFISKYLKSKEEK